MGGIKDFTKAIVNYTAVTTVGANYTALLTDQLLLITGAYTVTLPAASSLQGTTYGKKEYAIQNTSTSAATISPATGNTVAGRASWTLQPNETVVITIFSADTDWKIDSPFPTPALIRVPLAVSVNTNGTTPVNVFDATGAPTNIDITEVMVNAQDTTAGNISLANGSNTVVTIAKGITAGVVTGAGSLSYTAVSSGSALTVVSSSAGNARVTIIGTMQTYV